MIPQVASLFSLTLLRYKNCYILWKKIQEIRWVTTASYQNYFHKTLFLDGVVTSENKTLYKQS